MKTLKLKKSIIYVIAGLAFVTGSCQKELLNQPSSTELPSQLFWVTEADATYALNGAYSAVRGLFDKDYYWDGQGEFTRVSQQVATGTGGPYDGDFSPASAGASHNNYWKGCYGGINRVNYVIGNVTKMLATAKPQSVEGLETIIGEARLMRGMIYFRLISLWGDVPYFSQIVTANSQVQSLPRMPIEQVKDSIMADFNYALEKLPVTSSTLGRAAKPAALAFRGKLQLFWACWNKNGWPELDTFTPDATKASAAYIAAAADFKSVIQDYGLTLYMNGEPGETDVLGEADVLPNYWSLFQPAANGNPEMIMSFPHGSTGTGQGEYLTREFGTRSSANSQCFIYPRFELADRYQLTTTGDFAPPLVPGTNRATPNGAVNVQSYANRDYRMKSTMMWDYEVIMGSTNLESTGFHPWIYKTYSSNYTHPKYGVIVSISGGGNTGYIYRKYVRIDPKAARGDGDYAFPVMRLADVFLMYAEASNEINQGGSDALAVELVNKVRHRGNLPNLTLDKTTGYVAFFDAIEQERIVELIAEGHRAFDIRRWRILERIWGPPGTGKYTRETRGGKPSNYFLNATELRYMQNYIYKIPEAERTRNPNLTQNLPWR